MSKRGLDEASSESPSVKRLRSSPPEPAFTRSPLVDYIVDVVITNKSHNTKPLTIQACRVGDQLWTFFHWINHEKLFPLGTVDRNLLCIETANTAYSIVCADVDWDVCILQPVDATKPEEKAPAFVATDESSRLSALQHVHVVGKGLFHAPARAGPTVGVVQVIGVDLRHRSYIMNVPSTKDSCGAPAFIPGQDGGAAVLHGVLNRSSLVDVASEASRRVAGGSSLFVPAATFLEAFKQKRLNLPSVTRDRAASVTQASGEAEEGDGHHEERQDEEEGEPFWSGDRPTLEKVVVTMSDGTVHEREVGDAEWSDI